MFWTDQIGRLEPPGNPSVSKKLISSTELEADEKRVVASSLSFSLTVDSFMKDEMILDTLANFVK